MKRSFAVLICIAALTFGLATAWKQYHSKKPPIIKRELDLALQQVVLEKMELVFTRRESGRNAMESIKRNYQPHLIRLRQERGSPAVEQQLESAITQAAGEARLRKMEVAGLLGDISVRHARSPTDVDQALEKLEEAAESVQNQSTLQFIRVFRENLSNLPSKKAGDQSFFLELLDDEINLQPFQASSEK